MTSELSTATERSPEWDGRDGRTSDLVVAVAEAVGEATGTDSTALNEPLYHAVDPDDLARLVASMRAGTSTDGRVSFAMDGCRVTVHAAGCVVARPDDGSGTVYRAFDTDTGEATGDV